jgi:hypothetical protein
LRIKFCLLLLSVPCGSSGSGRRIPAFAISMPPLVSIHLLCSQTAYDRL